MKSIFAALFFRADAAKSIAPLCLLLVAAAALAQQSHPAPSGPTVPALLLSDIHFEPFFDPAKVPLLAAAPANEWSAILSRMPSPDQQKRFASLQDSCHSGGVDTSFPLFSSTLKAMRAHAAGIRFVTVSGDLISHNFDCKYRAFFPNSTSEDYRSFVEKTVDFVIGELYGAFPNTPVYVALGNNDSDCGDYRLDAHSGFLSATGKEVTKNFPDAERLPAEETFAAGGYYSIALPAPIKNARLLVLNDLFMAKNYSTCAGKPDPAAAEEQIAWLQQQVAEARANKQKLWVMGHIPPGVDLYSTVKRLGMVCGVPPAMFLSSEKIADVMADSSDVVKLAIFAHTHMDELRILKDDSPTPSSAKSTLSTKSVPVKMVSSISPNHGNNPSFTVAQIDPSTAALVDYRVFSASNQTGVNAKWTEEYDFARSYHATSFSSSSVSKLVAGFAADPSSRNKASQSYIGNFSAGGSSLPLKIFWPQYVCTLSNHTAEAFKACVCPAVP